MRKIEILDCTLRDGGYVNNWKFGYSNIKNIINSLTESNIKYIECGFLNNTIDKYNKDVSIFMNPNNVKGLVKSSNSNIALMIKIGDFLIEKLIQAEKTSVNIIRLAFHKEDIDKITDYAIKIKDKGYKLFIQPTNIINYNKKEIINLLELCNKSWKPDGIAIVDTLGEMNTIDVKKITKLFDINLNQKIKLIFHGHNNMQMAFSNAINFIETVNPKRNIIIDTSLVGMGRDAGNTCTELMITYLNKYYGSNYDYNQILKIINDVIWKYKDKYEWGYTPIFLLNAIKNVHPRYGQLFRKKNKESNLLYLDSLFDEIPIDKRYCFDKNIANKILNNYKNRSNN